MRRVVVQSDPVDRALHQSEADATPSPCRAGWQANERDSKTQALLEEDARYFLHPSLSTPCLNARRASSDIIYLEDLQGRLSTDLNGSDVHQVGLGDPAAGEAKAAALDELSFCTWHHTHRAVVNLARKLAETTPGDQNKMLWCPGATSVMGMALKLALTAAGRLNAVAMWHSFHGASLDTVSVGGETLVRHGVARLLPGVEHVRAAPSTSSRGRATLLPSWLNRSGAPLRAPDRITPTRRRGQSLKRRWSAQITIYECLTRVERESWAHD